MPTWDLDNTEPLWRMAQSGFCHASIIVQTGCPSAGSPAERIVNIGNVVCVKTKLFYSHSARGVRHFSMRRFQEHTIRWEIILKKFFFPSHCDLDYII